MCRICPSRQGESTRIGLGLWNSLTLNAERGALCSLPLAFCSISRHDAPRFDRDMGLGLMIGAMAPHLYLCDFRTAPAESNGCRLVRHGPMAGRCACRLGGSASPGKLTDTHDLYVGHSNHSLERLLQLIAGAQVTAIADVRSRPYSRWASQFLSFSEHVKQLPW